jgi:hypothetical protein
MAPKRLGQCRLCGDLAELQSSHLIPARAYHPIRAVNARNPNPVLISPETARTTSKQFQQPLLCPRCERRFNDLGERWTLGQMRKGNGSFRLRRWVVGNPADLDVSGIALHPGPPRTEYAVYFAASVVWRAAASDWRVDDCTFSRIELGPYEDRLARYLRGESDFPATAAIWICVLTHPLATQLVQLPTIQRQGRIRKCSFVIPGLQFLCWFGSELPAECLQACAHRTRYLMVSPKADEQILVSAAHSLQHAQK